MPIQSLHIAQATIADLDDAAVLFDQYRVFYQQESNLDAARSFLFNRFEHQESIIFLAKENDANGKSIGFAQLYPVFSSISMERSLILNDLFVDERFRGQGVGRKLLQTVSSYCELIHSKGIELSTATTNTAAQKLYEQVGYVKDEQYFHYFKKADTK
ncbi:Spermine/spermidine acetyltransferase [compost metagenome]